MYLIILFSTTLILAIIYVFFRLFIFTKSQASRVCKICQSSDTERVARSEMAKRLFSLKHLHKYWCRKCGNNFYLKVH